MRLRTFQLLLVQIAMLPLCASAQAPSSSPRDYGAAQKTTPGTIMTMPDHADDDTPQHLTTRPVDTPPRGMHASRVTAEYGEPLRRHKPVGQPPITRWDYEDYRLYFESDHVLHAVISGSPKPVVHAGELMSAAP